LKNFTLVITAGFLFATSLSAQTKKGTNPTPSQKVIATPQRCGTEEAMQQRLQTDPEYRARYEEGLRQYEESLRNPAARTMWTTSLTGPVVIPIVVHIVLPDPTVVTDADVVYFINRLNIDYAGLNADSVNAGPPNYPGANFMALRGHSLLRFTLAKRDPGGSYTTGIERKVGAGTVTTTTDQTIKQNHQ